MSGIFGFTCSASMEESVEDRLCVLEVWNRFYGHDGSEVRHFSQSALGCHVEHLSDDYPGGPPILRVRDGWGVVDAVLYNRDELLSQLNTSSMECPSDERLLLDWVEEKGLSALAQVNGDFAGAIYKEKTQEWVLFRDHLGVRPLFTYLVGGVFAFSTDLRGLAAMPEVDLAVNEERLYLRMMGCNYLSLCETEYQHIRCLRPGTWTTVRNTGEGVQMEEHPYWTLGQQKIRLSRVEDYQTELRRLTEDAVKRRLDACSGLVGGELSGGLDSGVIDILISRFGREGRYDSWSYDPKDLPLQLEDERRVIQDICDQEGITCHYRALGEPLSGEQFYDEMMPPYANTINISRTAAYLRSQGARVVFTGHGGDEGISHRCGPFELWYHREYLSFFRCFWQRTEGKSLRLLRTLKGAWHQIRRVNPSCRKPYQNEANAAHLLEPDFKARMKNVECPPLTFAYDPKRYVEQGGTRVRLDNVAFQGAQNGVRYMIPFADYRVMDFAVSIPRHLYRSGTCNRCLYRQAFRDILPVSLYEMQYKDAASLREYGPKQDMRDELRAAKVSCLTRLDRNFWSRYLNFEAIEAMDLESELSEAECVSRITALNELSQCAFLQHVRDNARPWALARKAAK